MQIVEFVKQSMIVSGITFYLKTIFSCVEYIASNQKRQDDYE